MAMRSALGGTEVGISIVVRLLLIDLLSVAVSVVEDMVQVFSGSSGNKVEVRHQKVLCLGQADPPTTPPSKTPPTLVFCGFF